MAEKNKALETVAKLGKQYVGKIKKHTVKMWSSAVLAGTIMGGVIIQLANDRLWTEHAVPKIADWFGYKRNPEKVVTTLTSPLAPSLSLTPSLDLSSGVANSSGALLAPPALKDFSVSPISIPQPFKAQPHLYNQFTRPQSTQPMPHTQYAGMGLRI